MVVFALQQLYQVKDLPNSSNRILVVTNYRLDKQYSMLRFGDLIASGYQKERFETKELKPLPIYGKFCTSSQTCKWARYIDKFLIFPRVLYRYLREQERPFGIVHIIDHSNSIYASTIKKFASNKCLVTCHDLIAIRSALGEFPSKTSTSYTGKFFQSWIHKSLGKCDYFACDSYQTKRDLNRLVANSVQRSKIIHLGTKLGLNARRSLRTTKYNFNFNLQDIEYILHVGSDSWYKNRKAILHSFIKATDAFPNRDFRLIFVGPDLNNQELSKESRNWIEENKSKVIILNYVDENILNLLYINALFLIFPSFIEGFGWPPIEASTKKCPVVCSRVGALGEILEDTAIFIDPENQNQINQEVINLLKGNRSQRINPSNMFPSLETCKSNYAELYEKIISNNHLIELE